MKRKYVWWFILLVILLPLGAAVAANRTLLFDWPEPEIVELPAIKMVYMDYKGPYVATRSEFVRFVHAITAENIQCDQLMGQYLDNSFVDASERRARLGCSVKEFPKKLPKELSQQEIAASKYVHATRHENGELINRKMAYLISSHALKNRYRVNTYWLEMYGPVGADRQDAKIYAGID